MQKSSSLWFTSLSSCVRLKPLATVADICILSVFSHWERKWQLRPLCWWPSVIQPAYSSPICSSPVPLTSRWIGCIKHVKDCMYVFNLTFQCHWWPLIYMQLIFPIFPIQLALIFSLILFLLPSYACRYSHFFSFTICIFQRQYKVPIMCMI